MYKIDTFAIYSSVADYTKEQTSTSSLCTTTYELGRDPQEDLRPSQEEPRRSLPEQL